MTAIGAAIGAIRTELGHSQEDLATLSGLSPNTIAGLERGRGTITSLDKVLRATGYRLKHHYDAAMSLGQHVATRRAMSQEKVSLQTLAQLTGKSKPTLMNVEKDRGRIESLASALTALGQPIAFVKAAPEWLAEAEAPVKPRSSIRRVIEGDCLSIMETLDPGSIDLVLTSPPYNAGKEYEKRLTRQGYEDFAREWTCHLPGLLSDKGAVWLNLGYMLDGRKLHPLEYIYHPIMEELGFHLVQPITWSFRGGMTYRRRFAHRTERLLWWVRDLDNYEFRLDHVRDLCERVTADKRSNPLGNNPTDLWPVKRVAGGPAAGPDKVHPCQMPVPIASRIIETSTRVGATVLDPFAGSGTTAVAAHEMGRGYIMIEQEKRYIRKMKDRLAKIEAQHDPSMAINTPVEKETDCADQGTR
ncbi:DNA methyltransferase [Methylobacterium sp. C1]|uniref:DNA methyltransferase n=1 Tax=Methylobacterium sp. C1 TaxID=1479019 RepID=UPI001FD8F626|nr:DNA methyltransferase [Methylobacterium sp. C1]